MLNHTKRCDNKTCLAWCTGVLVLLLSLLPLFSCAEPVTDGAVSLRLMWFGSEQEEVAIRAAVARFEEENPGHSVTVQMVEWTRFNEKIMTMLLGHRPPDVARMSVQWCQRYFALGALADARAHLGNGDLSDFVPSRLASCRSGDSLFGLPHTSISLLIYYNRGLFEQAGITPPRSPEEAWSWDEFSEVAQRLQRETGVRHGWGLYRGWFPVLPFLFQHGGHLLADGEPDFANPRNVEALEWLIDQHERGIAPRTSWARGGDSAETLFVRGDSAMVISGNWRLRAFSRQIEDFEWGVAPLPRDARRAANCGGENLVVFNTPRAEAASRLVEFLTSAEEMEAFCAETLFLPPRESLIASGVASGEHRVAIELFAQQSLDFEAEWAVAQSTPEFAAIDNALVRQLELAFLGFRSAEEVLQALNEDYLGARFQ